MKVLVVFIKIYGVTNTNQTNGVKKVYSLSLRKFQIDKRNLKVEQPWYYKITFIRKQSVELCNFAFTKEELVVLTSLKSAFDVLQTHVLYICLYKMFSQNLLFSLINNNMFYLPSGHFYTSNQANISS